MDLIVWARENPVLVIAALAIAVLVMVAMRMARVPDHDDDPHPSVPERPAVERTPPSRAPFARTAPVRIAPRPAPARTAAPQSATRTAPTGYVPLEVPELWEPPAGYLGEAGGPLFAPASRVASAPRVQPAPAAPMTSRAPVAVRPPLGATPRSFDDLRRGALAGRTFDSLQQFAVAAVVEAGHPVVLVARIFRVPSWKLENWVEAAFHAAPAPAHRPWRGTMPRAV